MTMGDESLFASMTMPVVIGPILEKLEQKDISAAQTLRSAFTKADTQHPGFAYELMKGILRKAEVLGQIDMTESLLRLEGMNTSTDLLVKRPGEPFTVLNERSTSLKKILSRIPDEIYDRKKFLETIKDIASAIRLLLDAVNNVFDFIQDPTQKQALEQRKREFVRCSRRFSNALKDFFKDNRKQSVFQSANHLVNQTNLIMNTVRDAC